MHTSNMQAFAYVYPLRVCARVCAWEKRSFVNIVCVALFNIAQRAVHWREGDRQNHGEAVALQR